MTESHHSHPHSSPDEAWKSKTRQDALTFREVVKLLRNSELPIQPLNAVIQSTPCWGLSRHTDSLTFQMLLLGVIGGRVRTP